MPWCPNCKMEYVDGITICADCGTELTEKLTESQKLITFMETEKELFAKKFVEFLHYSKIDSASCEFDEEKQQWVVLIEEKSQKQVNKLYKAFYSVETEHAFSGIKGNTPEQDIKSVRNTEDFYDNMNDRANSEDKESLYETDFGKTSEDETEESKVSDEEITDNPYKTKYESMFNEDELQEIAESARAKPIASTTYVKKEEQYKDLKSSAVTFLLVSILGIAVLILNAAGILNIFAGPIPFFIMGALFIAFLYVSFSSYAKAKKVEKEIEEENRTTQAINDWLSQNITAEQLDALTNPDEADEIRFFHKLEKMKEMITAEFGNQDEAYLDFLAEEYYNKNFEN